MKFKRIGSNLKIAAEPSGGESLNYPPTSTTSRIEVHDVRLVLGLGGVGDRQVGQEDPEAASNTESGSIQTEINPRGLILPEVATRCGPAH